jgi:cell division transport system permease protein
MYYQKTAASRVRAIAGGALVLLLVLLIVGVFWGGRQVGNRTLENMVVTVAMHDETTFEDARSVKAFLDKQAYVLHTRLIPKEEALKEMNQIEETSIDSFLGFNPLYNTIEINVRAVWVNTDSLTKIKDIILQNEKVRDVEWPNGAVEKTNNPISVFHMAVAVIAAILLIPLYFAASYTIKQYRNWQYLKTRPIRDNT